MTISDKFLKGFTNKRELSNIILFSLGKFVSLFGTFIYSFAIGLYVLKLTGSGLSFATTLAFSTLPMVIINPIGGVLADRLNRKVLVVLMDLFNGILLIGLYFLSLSYGLSLMMIYISTFIMTSFMTILDISFEAAKPNIVSDNNLMNVNSISKIIDSLSTILGPMIGGVLFAIVDIKLFIIVNGISFLFSGISEMFIDFKFNYKKELCGEKKDINFIGDMKQGLEYMMDKREIVDLFTILIILNFSIGLSITVPLPVIINNILKLGPKYLGIIQGLLPIGLIIGAIFVKKVNKGLSYNKILILMSFVLAICIIFIGLPILPFNFISNKTVLLIYYSLIMWIIGIAISLVDIPLLSIIQKNIDDEYRGRVLGLILSIAKIISPVVFIISGFLIGLVPIYLLQLIASLVLFISNIVHLKSNNIHFEFKRSLVSTVKISLIFFSLELIMFIITRPKNIEMFFFIFIFAFLLLLLENILNQKPNNSSYHNVQIYEIITVDIFRQEDAHSKWRRIYGGLFDEINPGYSICILINFLGYVLAILK
ncbi:MFS transporter [Maledivibacter halophilus]|uniref:Nitrate/nitrite transporter n=1 Tax=Maledivibacter halophilus TaxID=36842 RepID=A0A1T5J7T1_9FIRM|nr:MFS transporter [Maledivibacter halophilus]SKC47318.1 Nitrate/nitrite transporter [Maledivibacter halophilus]